MSRLHLYILQYTTVAALTGFTVLSACDTSVKTDNALVGEAVPTKTDIQSSNVFVIDTAKSQLTWIGAKITGRHNGYFKIKEGEFHLDENLLASGSIIIDMTSLRSDDKTIDQASNAKLTKHLKSADFFDSEKYNTATFELTGLAPYDSTQTKPAIVRRTSSDDALRVKHPTHFVTGNLTIKDKSKSITFPARITLEDDLLHAKANFNINRTDWGLVYRSDKSLGDQTIRPEVNIGFDVVAKPQSN